MWVSHIHGQLVNRLEPGTGKLSSESIIPKKYIGDTLTFGARKPSSNKRFHQWNIWFNHNRTARDDNHHTFDRRAHNSDRVWTRVQNSKVSAVTYCFRIRWLANNNNSK